MTQSSTTPQFVVLPMAIIRTATEAGMQLARIDTIDWIDEHDRRKWLQVFNGLAHSWNWMDIIDELSCNLSNTPLSNRTLRKDFIPYDADYLGMKMKYATIAYPLWLLLDEFKAYLAVKDLVEAIGENEYHASHQALGILDSLPSMVFGEIMDKLFCQILRLGRHIPELIPWGKSELDFLPPLNLLERPEPENEPLS